MTAAGALRAAVFDFGGVIAEEGFRAGLEAIAQRHGYDIRAFFATAQQLVYDTGFVVGRAGEADFWAALRARYPLPEGDAELTAVILDHFQPRPRMLAAVDLLRRHGRVTALLSDQTDWLERLDRRHGLFGHFDHVFNSYRLGRSKRDPALFPDITARLGLPPPAILFLDDDRGNVERARAAGWRTCRCSTEQGCLTTLQTYFPFLPRLAEMA